MKRIFAIFNKKLEGIKKERMIKRIIRSIETAMDNAEEMKDIINDKIDDFVDGLPECEDTNAFIQKLSDLIGEREEQDIIINRLKHIQSYLEEEIEVTE